MSVAVIWKDTAWPAVTVIATDAEIDPDVAVTVTVPAVRAVPVALRPSLAATGASTAELLLVQTGAVASTAGWPF